MAAGTCVTDLEQQLDRSWSGRVVKTGETKKFNTLDDYKRYLKSLETQGTYCPEVEAKYTEQYKPGKNTTPSGFLEFQPRDPVKQSKYSAMSSSWEGIDSSEAAIARGDYDLDQAEKNREDLRAKRPQPVLQMPQAPQEEPQWNCSIQ
jgi:hypothetical protein